MRIIDENVLAKELSDIQSFAALDVMGPQLILAGAGSGKTRTLTYKIAHLISRYQVDPRRILAVTFTNKAAGEMKERIASLLDSPIELKWMGTFHSICVRFLRRSFSIPGLREKNGWPYTASFTIYDDSDQKGAIRSLLKEQELEADAASIRKIRSYISNAKSKNLSPEAAQQEASWFEEEQQARIYELYQKKLATSNAMDFDDLLIKTVEILKQDNELRQRFSRQFQYVFVDEYQDTNPVQYDFLKLVIGAEQNVTVVGDDDQSIYGWRGADIEIIRNFNEDFQDVRIVKLEQNYRSTRNIVAAAGSVIENNPRPKDLEKKVFSRQEDGDLVKVLKIRDEQEEASRIAEAIVAEGAELYEKTAVFYRMNSQSRALEEQLNQMRIPLTIVGGVRFYDRKEIKDIFAYLRVLVNADDEVSLLRIINEPKRSIGAASVSKVQELARHKEISFFDAMSISSEVLSAAAALRMTNFRDLLLALKKVKEESPLPVLVEEVIEKSRYREMLQADGSEEGLERIANLDELISGVESYDEKNPESALEDYLQDMALLTDADLKGEKMTGVRLMTVHAAKGLEFPIVHIAGCDEGLFPLLRRSESKEDEEKLLEEERRLFYVAATRAEKKLQIYTASYRKIHGRDERLRISRFLEEMDSEFYETIDLRPDWEQGSSESWNDTNWNSEESYNETQEFSTTRASGSSSSFVKRWKKAREKRQNGDFSSKRSSSSSPKKFNAERRKELLKESAGKSSAKSGEKVYLDIGQKVRHVKFGQGVVLACSGNDENARITVRFQDGVSRKLIAKYARLQVV
jgi:DNA helicase-2/ATP-dependent DNA helicase PcrA